MIFTSFYYQFKSMTSTTASYRRPIPLRTQGWILPAAGHAKPLGPRTVDEGERHRSLVIPFDASSNTKPRPLLMP